MVGICYIRSLLCLWIICKCWNTIHSILFTCRNNFNLWLWWCNILLRYVFLYFSLLRVSQKYILWKILKNALKWQLQIWIDIITIHHNIFFMALTSSRLDTKTFLSCYWCNYQKIYGDEKCKIVMAWIHAQISK